MTLFSSTHHKIGVFRYLAIMLYDSLLLLSILFFAGLAAVTANGGDPIGPNSPLFLLYLLFVSGFFYGWFWTHGGQTLGLRTWKVTLISEHQSNISWRQAILRFITAIVSWIPLGLGFWWQWLGKENRSWPDIVSNTQLYYQKGQ